jgi:hypothetical protein
MIPLPCRLGGIGYATMVSPGHQSTDSFKLRKGRISTSKTNYTSSNIGLLLNSSFQRIDSNSLHLLLQQQPRGSTKCPLSVTRICQNIAEGVPAETGIIYATATYPGYLMILRMNKAVTQQNFTLLDELIDEYLCTPDPSTCGPDVAPGYIMGGLEPVFLHAILENRPSMVALLMSRGVHLCDRSFYKACEWDTSPEIFRVFLNHG